MTDAMLRRCAMRAVAALGASLGISTTAEGVETVEQMGRIREEGCTEAQGYLFSRPVSGDEVLSLLTSDRNVTV